MKTAVQLVWFKRDLRTHDHRPLSEAANTNLPVLPLYIVEPEYWQQKFASRRHWHFINDCLYELRQDCDALGQGLVVRVGELVDVLEDLRQHFDIKTVFAHEENGNEWTYERDKSVLAWAKNCDIPLIEYPNNGVVRRLKSRDDWGRIRNKRMAEEVIPKPSHLLPVEAIDLGVIPAKEDPLFGDEVPGITQPGGRRNAVKTLSSFLNTRGSSYLYHISAPGLSEQYCSRLSPHLAWGTLSVREALKATQSRQKNLITTDSRSWKRNLSAFSSRLSWRCHFMQKIEDQPNIESRCMHPAFEGMRIHEHHDQALYQGYLDAWKQGRTGYPLIDACMRNLIHEGWITFRMRAMLVSFASYQLWLDWRQTGYHLAQLFTDYEPGIHYSQLQMQSGVTGINTLRIYNPIKQSYEQDASGAYIRKWLPELKHISNMWIHEPWLMSATQQKNAHCIIGVDYPAPIIQHEHAIASARKKISERRKTLDFKSEANNVFQKLGSRKSNKKHHRKKTQKKSTATDKDNSQLGFEFD